VVRSSSRTTTSATECWGFGGGTTEGAPTPRIDRRAAGRVETTVPRGYVADGFDVGRDNMSAVSPAYRSPFPFGGTVRSVTIAVEQ
jgi:hypothetical protein